MFNEAIEYYPTGHANFHLPDGIKLLFPLFKGTSV